MFTRIRNLLAPVLPNRRTVIASAAGEGHLANPADVLGNPLRNLTPANAAVLLQNAMRGQ